MSEKPLDLDIKLKPVLKYKWGNEEGFRNFKKGYEKGFNEAQEILIKEIKQRIKLAVQGLLDEIHSSYGCIHHRKKGGDDDCIICVAIGQTLNEIRRKIKKYFPEVVKENE